MKWHPIKEELNQAGFDLIHGFDLPRYQNSVEENNRFQAEGNGLLIGNSKALWKPFLQWLSKDSSRLQLRNPLDDYVEEVIESLFANQKGVLEIRYSHRPQPDHIGFVKLAHQCGLAWQNKTGLCIHEKFGPWIALRCALVLSPDLDLNVLNVSEEPDSNNDEANKLEKGMEFKPMESNPCSSCESKCFPAFDSAMRKSEAGQGNLLDWLLIRESCPLGSEERYSKFQTLYHYTKDPEFLVAALQECGSQS